MKTIFISSTFQDMQHERDIIQAKVLPRIREFIKQYGETIELCDLRWGIDSTNLSESESTEKILQVCFDEIDNSRPFFIGLLGDRYGWTPNSDLVRDILATQGRIIPESLGKSVTEMEILYGAFLDGNEDNQSMFYFRTIEVQESSFGKSTLPEMYLSQNPEDKKKILALKNKIAENMPDSVRSYILQWDNDSQELYGLDSFAEKVFEDLKAIISARLGKVPVLSEYELSRRQQMYATESESFFSSPEDISMNLPPNQSDFLLKGIWTQDFQNLFLSAKNAYSLNRLVASLCRVYNDKFDYVIPFDCGQSPISGTLGGLLSYLLGACRKILNDDTVDNISSLKMKDETQDSFYADVNYESSGRLLREKRKSLHECFNALDKRGKNILFVIRNMDKLKGEDSLWWLPLQKYSGIRFIISSYSVPVLSEQLQKITKTVFISSDDIFERSQWVNVYLRKYHKQIDDASKRTLLEMAEGKHEQYLEFLLQRLLILDEKDFSVIRENGGGIEAISSYFCSLLRKQPDNLEDITCRMSEHLQEVIDSKFVRSVTGMLLAAPYGLSEQLIREIDSEESIGYSRLNMRTFCRACAPLLVETLDGYIRFNDTPAADILRGHFRIDMRHGAECLERYMRKLLESKTEHEIILRDQYLQIAFHAEANKALVCYMRAFQKDPEQISVSLWELMSHDGADIWLKNEMTALSLKEYFLIAHEIYPLFRLNGWINDTAMKILESCRDAASKNLPYDFSHRTLGLIFALSYECGETAYRLDNPEAEYYLMSAKEISKLDFKVFYDKNEHIKNVFGRSLTGDEIERVDNFLRENHSLKGNDIVSAINFTEVANFLIKQSWSPTIYIIDRQLSMIYKKQGDIQKAKAFQDEAEKIACLFGIENQDAEEQMLLEEDHGGTGKRESYRPDFRRDIAIRIAQKAAELQENGEHQAAFEKLEESNEILREIYNDGEDKKYYDLSGAGGDPEQAAEYIRSECLRDMSKNFSAMARSADAMKMPDEKIIELLEMMLENGRAFDDERNSKESKLNLENYYYTAANVCFSRLENHDYLRCLSYCEKYFHYREEAFAKGEDWSDDVSERWHNVASVFYQCVTQQPGQGSRATNILYEISNKSVMYNDLIGYAGYTNLASDLLVWTRQNGMNWTCNQTSLESVYINQVRITCAMWEQNQEWLLLEHDASKLEQMIDYLLENDSRTKTADILSQLGLYYFRQGDYDKAVSVSRHVMKCLTDDGKIICPFSVWLHHQNRYVSALSEAGNLEEAEREAEKEEIYIDDYSQDISEHDMKMEIAALYINRAITQSRMGADEQAKRTLAKAESYIQNDPELQKINPVLIQRVKCFKEHGLPQRKDLRDEGKECREKLEEISRLMNYCRENLCSISHSKILELEQKVKQLEETPEYRMHVSCYLMASTYYQLFQFYFPKNDTERAFRVLRTAFEEYVRKDSDIFSVYGDIIAALSFFVEGNENRIEFVGMAIKIFDDLRKNGKEYSQNSLAIALRNRGLFFIEQKRYQEARNDVENAVLLWKELLREKDSKEIKDFLADADSLLVAIREKIATNLT